MFLDVKQAGDLLGIKASTVYKWIQGKTVPYRKHGRLVRFNRRDLLEWSKSREIRPYSEGA